MGRAELWPPRRSGDEVHWRAFHSMCAGDEKAIRHIPLELRALAAGNFQGIVSLEKSSTSRKLSSSPREGGERLPHVTRIDDHLPSVRDRRAEGTMCLLRYHTDGLPPHSAHLSVEYSIKSSRTAGKFPFDKTVSRCNELFKAAPRLLSGNHSMMVSIYSITFVS